MKSKRPIDQHRLRHRTPDEAKVLNLFLERFTMASRPMGEHLAIFGKAFRRAVHNGHPRPCYCLEPRRVAIALRRRDRKRGVRRRYPWIPVGYFDETGPPRLAPFWYRVPEVTP